MISNRQAIENWLTGKSKARSQNIYYKGDTIYSYGGHFPMARKYPKRLIKGEPIALVKSDKYSVTTSRHQFQTGHALFRAGYHTLEVASVDIKDVKRNLDFLEAEADQARLKQKRARVEHTRSYWTEKLEEVIEAWYSYRQLVESKRAIPQFFALYKLRQ